MKKKSVTEQAKDDMARPVKEYKQPELDIEYEKYLERLLREFRE